MKVSLKRSYKDNTCFTIELQEGHQYFRLDYHAKKEEALWYARMFRKALKKHNKNVEEKCLRKQLKMK